MIALVAHHVRKDVRLLAPILLAWLALTVALHVVVLVGAATYGPRTGEARTITILFNVLLGLNTAGLVAVTVLVLQTDPATGTTAFWLTRPVSVPLLLAAKCATLVPLLVIVPVALDVLTLLVAGVPLLSALAFVTDSLFVQLAWLLPVVAAAAITTTLARFVVVAAAEVSACGLIMTTITWLGGHWQLPPSGSTYAAVLVGVLSALSIAVLVISYGWRHTGGGIAVACMAPMILCFAATRWPPRTIQDVTPPLVRSLQRSVKVPLVPGSPFRLAEEVGELLSARVSREGYEVVLRQVGPRPRDDVRRYAWYTLRNLRGETLASPWSDRVDDPFFVMVVPVPQHLGVWAKTVVFPWTERPDTDLDTWVKGAVLVITER